jgi:phosphoglycolate phosphatase
MPPRVILFDIDGTLVDCGGAGRLAMERAFADRMGRTVAIDFAFGGMTDRAIARQGLEAAGREPTPSEIAALLDRYLGHLARTLEETERFRVLPGVLPVLDALDRDVERGELALGLGTGNLEAGATLKLVRGGLDGRFAFGGFGSDAEARAELLEAGARRGAAKLGRARSDVEVLVIGDTPKDVSAGQAIGARVVAVATGRYERDVLREAGADHALASLEDPVLAALLGL